MYNEGNKPVNGFIPSSFRAISGYLRIVSSGASTVASTVRSAAQSIAVDKGDIDSRHDQVLWAGFDKLEFERDITRRVLLLGYRSGFQVWDVEDAHNVHDLVSRHDGPVSFLQMLPKPSCTAFHKDKFSDSRPLLVVYSDGSSLKDGKGSYRNGNISKIHDSDDGPYGPSTLQFYSLTSHSYVHVLKFRSSVYSVRCSSRVVAVSQTAQVHCFNAATLDREYTILTNPVITSNLGSEGVGYGPLALGARWLAYSGSPVELSNSGCVTPQHLNKAASFPNPVSNSSRVALYAKESSNYVASGIVTLGDKSYKKLSRYCSDLRPGANHVVHSGGHGGKVNGTISSHLPHINGIEMVIVRDVVTKAVITQFRAPESPISALCFDPSGTILVTASIQGHNINVFRILPVPSLTSSKSDTSRSYIHLYTLQRGLTNAIIQDISFSNDSRWVMISSSRGTSHLFNISPFGGTKDLLFSDSSINESNFTSSTVVRGSSKPAGQTFDLLSTGPPITLSVVSRIRNGNNGWRNAVNGSSSSSAVATTFRFCEGNDDIKDFSLKPAYNLLVFASSGYLKQYALRISLGLDTAYESAPANDAKLVVEATRKWNICQKRRERDDNYDIYGENGGLDSNKKYGEGAKYNNGAHNQFYISEAELQMHEQVVPLWAKPQICFHSMTCTSGSLEVEDAGGEIEIENTSTRAIEARRKNLVPVFDYLSSPKPAQARVCGENAKLEPQLLHHRPRFSQNGHLSKNGSALDLVTENGVKPHGMEESGEYVLNLANTTMGSVYSNGSPELKPEVHIVNTRDSAPLKTEANLKFVNTYSEELKMEKQLEYEAEEFD